jgi:putative two-component system response regulator
MPTYSDLPEMLDLPASRRAGNEDVKGALLRLHAQIKARRQNASASSFDFLNRASAAVGRIRGGAHHAVRIECLWDCGGYFHAFGNHSEALRCARDLAAIAERARSKHGMRLSHTLAGMAFGDLGDIGGALIQYEKGLRIAQQHDPAGIVPLLVNIGVVFNYSGLRGDALNCFHRAYELASADAALAEMANSALTNIALSHLLREEYREGYVAIRRCLLNASEPTNDRTALSRAIREWIVVQLALELGEFAEAREHSLLCFRYGNMGDNPKSRSLAEITQGLCEVTTGSVETGLTILERALEHAADVAMREDILRALVKANDEAGRPDQALEYVRRLISQISAARKTALAVALTLNKGAPDPLVRFEMDGMKALELREAKLRAAAAENHIFASRIEMLERLAITADLKEEMSGEHGYRVGKMAALISDSLGWERTRRDTLERAARLHDIGKVGMPDRILLSSKQLQEAERHFMSTHAIVGAELLATSDVPEIKMAEEIARFHHEWWNGKGYPTGRSGKRIPLTARIVAIADVFDALTHGRPYAEPWPIDKALSEIRERRGSQFDPELTDAFLELVEKLMKTHQNLDAYLAKGAQSSPFLQARARIRKMLDGERT